MVTLAPSAQIDPPGGAEPRVLRASFDPASVVVWQAHADAVADEALANGRFGGRSWRTDRVTRFRLSLPSLLARCAWGARPGRERILAVYLERAGFDALLNQAVHAEFEPAVYTSRAAWHLATRYAHVTLTWHPDIDYSGAERGWQTPRIGLRDHVLGRFTTEWVRGVEDWTPWVVAHRGGVTPGTPVPAVADYPLPAALSSRLAGRRA